MLLNSIYLIANSGSIMFLRLINLIAGCLSHILPKKFNYSQYLNLNPEANYKIPFSMSILVLKTSILPTSPRTNIMFVAPELNVVLQMGSHQS